MLCMCKMKRSATKQRPGTTTARFIDVTETIRHLGISITSFSEQGMVGHKVLERQHRLFCRGG